MQQPLRIIFAGTPHFAQAHLEALLAAGHQIVALFTQPDRAAGRGKKVTASPLKQFGQQHALPLFQPPSLRSAACEQQISDLQADVMVVVAYGLILPPTLLNKPRLGCINVHASLLPRWRGAAPIQRALLAGDRESGITIMQMDAGLDTGAILSQVACPITADETSATLQSKLACIGPVTLLETLQRLAQGTLIAQPQQNESATYAEKISKQEACLDWQQPAVVLEHAVRAFNPWPLSYFMMAGQTVKVWQAKALPLQTTTKGLQPIVPKTIVQADRFGIQVATTDGVLNLQQLQLPGRKPIAAYDLLNAHREWFIPGRLLD